MKKSKGLKGVLGVLGVLGVMECGGLPPLSNAWAIVTVYPGGATYTTIQAAVDACPVGGTVSVEDGKLYKGGEVRWQLLR